MIPPAPTHAVLTEVLEKHLCYEFIRFAEQHELLRNPEPYRAKLNAEDAKKIDDSLIVRFCTHARNLLEFFFRDKPTKFNYALAIDYAKTGYNRLDRNRSDVERLYGQLCAQINHLTTDRTDDATKKVGPVERDELVALIHAEAARLEKDLQPGFDKRYLAVAVLAQVKPSVIKAGAIGPSTQPVVSSTTPSLPSVNTTGTPPVGYTGPIGPKLKPSGA
jgi:hypothetical protein